MQQLTTNKLFYGKYLYRIKINKSGIGYLHRCNMDIHFVMAQQIYTDQGHKYNYPELGQYATEFAIIKANISKIRVEGWHGVQFYVDTEDNLNAIKSVLSWCISSITSPNKTDIVHMSDKNIIMCNALPHGLYRYKLHLKSRIPKDVRLSFLEWTKTSALSTKFTKLTESWLDNTKPYFWSPTMYVKDDAALMMVNLFMSNYIHKTDIYTLRE
jgi:hypothetical protein